jgi:alanyl-tRNA synthetase
VIQSVQSNYDIDLFQSLIRRIEELSGKKYGTSEKTDIAFRVIADHIRAISFSIADGQLPSNTGAGYVIRRILRRAVRYGYQTLGFKQSFLADIVNTLAGQMSGAFPELAKQKDLIEKVIREEEQSFFRTLENGLGQIEGLIAKAKKAKSKQLGGGDVFELYDTFGFPIDLTRLIARENGLDIDEAGFNAALEKQKDRSRAASQVETDDWVTISESGTVNFVGYDELEATVYISKYRKVKQKGKELIQLVLNKTPFYPEGGGQVGDTGLLISESGEKIDVVDTKKENNLIVHFVTKLPADPSGSFTAVVNAEKRRTTQANHSVTHLLHHHLRAVLGTHVAQKGSLVHPDYLRFDFSHFAKVTDEELAKIEKLVNGDIAANIKLNERRGVPMKEAMELGAMALFGEKYGDTVRVIQFGNSVELCGGCHVKSTGEIGPFKIISEGSVAAGVRRIEAISSEKADQYFRERISQFDEISALLKNPKDIKSAVQELIDRNNALTKQIEVMNRDKARQIGKEILSSVTKKGDINFVSAIVECEADGIKDICFKLKDEVENVFGVIGGTAAGKASLSVVISDSLLSREGFHAGNLVRESAKLIQGGGGGQPFFATAGGKDPNGLKAAIDKVCELTKIK